MSLLDTKPAADEIAAHLHATYRMPPPRATSWSRWLEGLPWRFLKPVCQMAVHSQHQHPAIAVGFTARATEDEAAREVLTAHLNRDTE